MSIIRTHKNKNYTVINNTGLRDTELSWKAKGLLTYLISLPDGWDIYLSDLKNRSKNGRDSTNSAIKELENAGYIERHKKYDSGKFRGYDYDVYEVKQSHRVGFSDTGKPIRENRYGKTDTDNPTLLSTEKVSTKKVSTEKVNTNKEGCKPPPYNFDKYSGQYTPQWLLDYIAHHKDKLSGYIPSGINADCNQPALQSICEWLQYRRERKKKYTTLALMQFFKRTFSLIGPDEIPGIISESIGSGWVDLIYKGQKLSKTKTPPPPFGDMISEHGSDNL